MKFRILALAAILTLGVSTVAFATAGTAAFLDRGTDGTVTIAGTSPVPSLTLKPSANVFFSWAKESGGTAYSIGTLHTSGSFTYATTSTDTNIYRYANASNANATSSLTVYTGAGAKCPSSPANATDVIAWGTGWTASK